MSIGVIKMQTIKFKGSASDGVIRTYEKQARDINGLNIDIKNKRIVVYTIKIKNRIYYINKDVFFDALEKLQNLNLHDINFSQENKMKSIWNKIADIATEIFVGGFALIVILAIIGTIGAFVIEAWFFLWNWNKFVFGIYLIFLISGAITAINWLIFNIKNQGALLWQEQYIGKIKMAR